MPIKIVPPSPSNLHAAVEALRAGGLVAVPTETVYGLAADAANDRAVAQIFASKQRPAFNPLIIHFADAALAEGHVIFDGRARKLAKAFWPGPLTLVLPRTPGSRISLLASAGLDSLAVRVPCHPVALDVLKGLNRPLAAPSANVSGGISPSCAEHVLESFRGQDALQLILDGGACEGGIESTILNLMIEPAAILRPGLISREQIEAMIGPLSEVSKDNEQIISPGQMMRHYAPKTKVRLKAETVKSCEALLAFGPHTPQGSLKTLNLSVEGNLVEAAANLFAMLHALDRPQFSAIAVMDIPMTGIGVAINDRLRRAAT